MKIREDNLGVAPAIGDTVVYNPPYYKGLRTGKVVGFKKGSGLPIVEYYNSGNPSYTETPKTGFIVLNVCTCDYPDW